MKSIDNGLARRSGQRTIISDLTRGLVIVVSLILVLLGVLYYFWTAVQLENTLKKQSVNSVAKMAEILSIPIWTLDLPSIRNIGESFAQSDNIVAVKIIDESGETLFISPTSETGLITTRHPVEYNGLTIGYVEVSLSTKGIADARQNFFLTTILTILLVVLSIQVATRQLLQRYLAQPLKSLIQGVDSIANGSDYHGLAPVPQADINEIIQGVNSMARQIQERVESLRQSEDRFRQVIISISDMIYLTEITPDGSRINHYISPDAQEFTGYPAECFLNDWMFWSLKIVLPEDQRLNHQKWRTLLDESRCETEYRLMRKDQSIIWVRDSARMEKFGESRMVYGVISDITGRKKVEADLRAETAERSLAEQELRKYQELLEERVSERTAELEEANKELESFAYTISHDLRSPLRHMDGYSQMVIEDFGSRLPPEGLQQLQRIRFGVQRMSDLIDGLLKFSRLSRHSLNLQPVDPSAMVHSVLEELAVECQGRQIDFRLGALPTCQADAILLGQVFLNLIQNAIKYTQQQKAAVIEIGAATEGDQAVFFIRDNGIGIDMQYSNKLFGVFQRLHSNPDYEGTGVGLAIVHRIISRHGGRIWVESALNQGSTFYFTLPPAAKEGL